MVSVAEGDDVGDGREEVEPGETLPDRRAVTRLLARDLLGDRAGLFAARAAGPGTSGHGAGARADRE